MECFGAARVGSLWDGIECYIDHHWANRSIKDLAGVLHAPEWDASAKGIKAKLRAVGPGATTLAELGRVMLNDEVKPDVGFSADLIFTAKEKKVEKILRVLSVDLVIDPARGGAFLRALNQSQERTEKMEPKDEQEKLQQEKEAADALAAKLANDVKQQAAEAITAEVDKARAMRLQLCGLVLDAALKTSKLPTASAEIIRRQFASKLFEEAELTQAIADQQKLVSELTGGMVVSGPGSH